MHRKFYDYFVNQNYTVKRRYEGFVLSHTGLHHKCRLLSWGYLLWLNLCFNVLHLPDRKKIRTGNESGTGFGMSAEETAKLLCQQDIVSFDMFDTLIFRPFSAPTDVFYLIGEQLQIPDFRSIRIQAEKTARERRIASHGNGEVNLSEIYTVLGEELGIDPEYGASVESKTEISLCMPNSFMLKVWKQVQTAGKRIIITTDMYLPREVLSAMLEKCGFSGYDAMFLSNEHGFGKYNGKLFDLVKSSYPGQKFSHIGDNKHADVDQAEKAGFHALYYPNVNVLGSDFRPDRMSFLTGSAYSGLVNRRMYSMGQVSPAYEYGYKCGGILMLGFCEWIHAQVEETHAEKILFFARDGYIMKKIYDILYPDAQTEYVYWSRAAAAKLCAQIYPQDYFRRFLTQKIGRQIPLREILAAMDLTDLELPFSMDEPLTEENLPAVQKALRERMNEIAGLYAPMYDYADQYLGKILGDCKKAVTVDCGWAGSGSIFFERYVQKHMGRDTEITGLLAGSNSHNQPDSDFSESYFKTGKLRSYCFSAEHNRDLYETHFPAKKHNIYFELLCGALEPSCRGFDEKGAVLDTEAENADLIREIHAGEMAFISDYLEAFEDFPYMRNISGSDAYQPSAVSVSGKYAASVFANCIFDETTGGRKEKI